MSRRKAEPAPEPAAEAPPKRVANRARAPEPIRERRRKGPPLSDRLADAEAQMRLLDAAIEQAGTRDVQGLAKLISSRLQWRREYDSAVAEARDRVVLTDEALEDQLVDGLVAMTPARRARVLARVAERTQEAG